MKLEYESGVDPIRFDANSVGVNQFKLISYGLIFLEFNSDSSVTTTTTHKEEIMEREARYQGNLHDYVAALSDYLSRNYSISLTCVTEGELLKFNMVKQVTWLGKMTQRFYVDDNQYLENNLLEYVKKVLILWKLIKEQDGNTERH